MREGRWARQVTSRLLASRLKSGEGGSRATVPEVRPTVVLDQLRFPESTRWRGDRLWLCNWLASEVLAVDPAEGLAEVMATAPVPIPFCIDWLPDGRLLMTDQKGDGNLADGPTGSASQPEPWSWTEQQRAWGDRRRG